MADDKIFVCVCVCVCLVFIMGDMVLNVKEWKSMELNRINRRNNFVLMVIGMDLVIEICI